MPDDPPDPASPSSGLRARLAARGAKPHSPMSDLSRYLLAHQDELQTLISDEGYGWADIAAFLAEEEGLTDEIGKPVTLFSLILAWSWLRRRGLLTATPTPTCAAQADAPALPDDTPPSFHP